MKRLLIVHGPNLNLLGEREPDKYGTQTLAELDDEIAAFVNDMGIEARHFQSNHEGHIIDFIHQNRKWADGIVINPGALTHYSYALRDAIAGVALPCVEVHLSDIHNREPFRRVSVLDGVVLKQIAGLKLNSYLRGIEHLVARATLEDLSKRTAGATSDKAYRSCVALLKERFTKYNWVGIYLLEGDELILHNFLGRPTPHTRIPVGEGICGAAVTEEQSVIVPDVTTDSRYLECSLETRSEIVVPILRDGRVIGEIDIDSDLPDAFHAGDQEFIEKCARILGQIS